MKTICNWPGCGEIVELPARYCEKHKKLKEEEKKQRGNRWRGSAASRGYDYRWQKFRKSFLMRHPVCAMCGRLATDVDHIVPLAIAPTRKYDESNLQALCHECHSRKTVKENGGFGNVSH